MRREEKRREEKRREEKRREKPRDEKPRRRKERKRSNQSENRTRPTALSALRLRPLAQPMVPSGMASNLRPLGSQLAVPELSREVPAEARKVARSLERRGLPGKTLVPVVVPRRDAKERRIGVESRSRCLKVFQKVRGEEKV